MAGEYASDVASFLTHRDVTWRESMDGTSFVIGVALIGLAVGIVVSWRRHAG